MIIDSKDYDDIFITNLKGKIDFDKFPYLKPAVEENIEEIVIFIKYKREGVTHISGVTNPGEKFKPIKL